MKYLIPALLIFTWFTQSPTASDHHKKNNDSTHPQQGESRETKPTPPVLVPQESPSGQPSKANNQDKSNQANAYPDDWLKWLNAFSTAIIAIFAVLTCMAVFFQVCTARRAERAWVAVEVKQDTERSKTVSAFGGGPVVDLECVITNCGKTPARLTGFQVRQQSLSEDAVLGKAPDYGDTLKHMDNLFLSPNGKITERFHAEGTALDFFKTNEGYFYVYGVVDYLDAFGKRRYTKFCYNCWFPFTSDLLGLSELSFRREGPPAYNSAT
jgi:hypothetical protein